MPLVANNLIIIGLWKILGAKRAEDYKHVSKYQLVMGQPVCKGVCLEDRGEGTKKATRVGCLFSTSGLRRRRRAFCGRGGDGR